MSPDFVPLGKRTERERERDRTKTKIKPLKTIYAVILHQDNCKAKASNGREREKKSGEKLFYNAYFRAQR